MNPIYFETVPNRNSPPAILLREGPRDDGKTRKRKALLLTASKSLAKIGQ